MEDKPSSKRTIVSSVTKIHYLLNQVLTLLSQLQTIGIYPPQKLRFQLGDNIDSGNLETPNLFHSPILGFVL